MKSWLIYYFKTLSTYFRTALYYNLHTIHFTLQHAPKTFGNARGAKENHKNVGEILKFEIWKLFFHAGKIVGIREYPDQCGKAKSSEVHPKVTKKLNERS